LGIEDFESAVSKKDGRYLLDRLRGCNEWFAIAWQMNRLDWKGNEWSGGVEISRWGRMKSEVNIKKPLTIGRFWENRLRWWIFDQQKEVMNENQLGRSRPFSRIDPLPWSADRYGMQQRVFLKKRMWSIFEAFSMKHRISGLKVIQSPVNF
jgi:hypothetical protein